MEPKIKFIQEKMGEIMTDCVDHTTTSLEKLCKEDADASMRVVVLTLLADTWEKTPLPMGMPYALKSLREYANKHNVFVFHVGELIRVMKIMKGDGNISTPINLN